MSRYNMLQDLSLCVGCGGCAIACKVGNNTQQRKDGQTFNWADVLCETNAAPAPDTRWMATPVRCNHCVDPRCVEACPVEEVSGRAAMYKDATTGLVLHDEDRCIECGNCQRNCPYSTVNVGAYKAEWSAISLNKTKPQSTWSSIEEFIPDCTSSAAEVAVLVGATPPSKNVWTVTGHNVNDITATPNGLDNGIPEKCYFCAHRILSSGTTGDAIIPHCILACAASSRKIITNDAKFDPAGSIGAKYAAMVDYQAITDDAVDASGFVLPAGAKVLAHGSMKKAHFAPPGIFTHSNPNMFYVGTFNK